ncbi:MAG: hypothetical protein ACR2KW_05385 [Rubrobacter sp.]
MAEVYSFDATRALFNLHEEREPDQKTRPEHHTHPLQGKGVLLTVVLPGI